MAIPGIIHIEYVRMSASDTKKWLYLVVPSAYAVIQPPTLQVIHQGTYFAPSAIMLASKSAAVVIDAVHLTHVSLIWSR